MDRYNKYSSDTYNDPNDDPADNWESEEGMSVHQTSGSFNQLTRSKGQKSDADFEFDKRLNGMLVALTPVERQVFDLVRRGESISSAAKRLGVSQPRAQKCWQNIKRKLPLL